MVQTKGLIQPRQRQVRTTVFYSWQSDLPNATNRTFILAALEGAADDLREDEDVEVEPVVDRDTFGVAGAPDIGQTILHKIDTSTVFVCDVSIINSETSDARPMPNPNVLIELGYALKALGHASIIMVMNTAFGPPENLPFDLRQKRAVTYSLREGADRNQIKRALRSGLRQGIKTVLLERSKAAARSQKETESARTLREDEQRLLRELSEEVGDRFVDDAPIDPTELRFSSYLRSSFPGLVRRMFARFVETENGHRLVLTPRGWMIGIKGGDFIGSPDHAQAPPDVLARVVALVEELMSRASRRADFVPIDVSLSAIEATSNVPRGWIRNSIEGHLLIYAVPDKDVSCGYRRDTETVSIPATFGYPK